MIQLFALSGERAIKMACRELENRMLEAFANGHPVKAGVATIGTRKDPVFQYLFQLYEQPPRATIHEEQKLVADEPIYMNATK